MLKTYKEAQLTLNEVPKEQLYAILLQTVEWHDLRNKLFTRDNNTCRSCKSRDNASYIPIVVELTEFDKKARKAAISSWVNTFFNIRKLQAKSLGRDFHEERERTFLFIEAEKCHANYKYERLVLQLHHTYYIHESLPWQYKPEALITLCLTCHKDLHSRLKIPVYFDDSLSDIYGYRDNCSRCGGSGYLSEFSHVQNGVCFECGGQGGTVNRV